MNANMIDPTILERAQQWLSPEFDEETRKAVAEMIESHSPDLTESFYQDLEFGTGGLRGIMGPGTNRMNKYTVAMATQGLANYVKQSFTGINSLKAVIAFDVRNNSSAFAEITAQVFAGNGFEVFLFEDMRPTPELSFAVRELHCQVGVVVTASHNPKEYNGYKAYWNDGAQLVAPHDTNVIAEVRKITSIKDVKFSKENIHIIGEDIDRKYLDKVKALSIAPEAISQQHDLKIVYTPLHGTGSVMVPRALGEWGFTNVSTVTAQMVKDGNFSTVKSPNPEEHEALRMAIALAAEQGASLVLATDPDADRVGVAVRNAQGEYVLLNGNQTAAILTDYILRSKYEKKQLTGHDFIVKTIVTTDLMKDIAEHYGVDYYNVLTGFKFIADVILHEEGKKNYLCGGEESYGFLIGDFVRDKDAVSACCMMAEMAAKMAGEGKTLLDYLTDIYLKYGFYKESLLTITKPGKAGLEEIKAMMTGYRNHPPVSLAGSKIMFLKDYKLSISKNLITGETEVINLPTSDVLQFITEDGTIVSVRPSGTEPKIKFYFGVKEKLASANELVATEAKLLQKIELIKKDLGH